MVPKVSWSSSRHGHSPGLGSPNCGKAVFVLEDSGLGVYTESPQRLRLPSSLSKRRPGEFLESIQY